MDKIRCEYCKQRQDANNDHCVYCGAQLPDVVRQMHGYEELVKDGVEKLTMMRQNVVYSFAVAGVEPVKEVWNDLEQVILKALRQGQ